MRFGNCKKEPDISDKITLELKKRNNMGVANSNSPLHKFICDLEIASPKHMVQKIRVIEARIFTLSNLLLLLLKSCLKQTFDR